METDIGSSVNLPIKLLWPASIKIANHSCSMVGLQDIIIPGLLLSFCNRIDQQI